MSILDKFKKCSRCRVRRTEESDEDLHRYATCFKCRQRRKVAKHPLDLSVPNTFTEFLEFVSQVKTNCSQDILDYHYRGVTDPNVLRRYGETEPVEPDEYQAISKQLVHFYVNPIMIATGFRFAIRDYHKGGQKNKKIMFMFVCSQDKGKQRGSRASSRRSIANKLKTEDCQSKLNLTYNLNDGSVHLDYNHKSHHQYNWKKSEKDELNFAMLLNNNATRITTNPQQDPHSLTDTIHHRTVRPQLADVNHKLELPPLSSVLRELPNLPK